MTEVMEGYYYTKTHEWVKKENEGLARIGLTDYAQHQLSDIAYVELPEVGEEFAKGDEIAVVESMKSSSETFSPISGEIKEVNSELEDSPELINESPYEAGWLVLMTISNEEEFSELMDPEAYSRYL
ncbi:MAG: glycine cleavage system protein GcvH, partial [Thermoplasmata archaeon]|nr:glycine cleavage system protein GcvH [Thermoplasmata archaeon]